MRLLLKLTSVVLFTLGIVCLLSTFYYLKESNVIEHPIVANTNGFTGFPLNVERPVELSLLNSSSFGKLSTKEKEEQIRDWLLYTVLTSTGLDEKKWIETTFDMSPLRRGYMDMTTSFQHGDLRTVLIKEGIAIVLIPKGISLELRHDYIAQVADKHTMQQQKAIDQLQVFEYCINLPTKDLSGTQQGQQSITITHLGPITGDRLYSTEFGHVSKNIHEQSDLEDFLKTANDLIDLKIKNSTVFVTGRKYKSRSFRQLTIEHIATLWQAYEQIEIAKQTDHEEQNRIVRQWADKFAYKFLNEKFPEIASDIVSIQGKNYTFSTDGLPFTLHSAINKLRETTFEEASEIFSLFYEIYGTCKWQARLEALRGSGDVNQVKKQLIQDFITYKKSAPSHQRSLLRGSIGFSLDSGYDFPILQDTFLKFLETDETGVSIFLSKFKDSVLEGLKSEVPDLLLCLLENFNESDDDEELFRYIDASILEPSKYQVARYDGGIEGTEVGQILFITDLLAKVLDSNFGTEFNNYFEEAQIDWIPTVYRSVPVHYKEQQRKLPGTRIWFGLKNEAYNADQVTVQVRFAHIATRVFALSRKVFGKDIENQPTYLAAKFVDWFNNYYDQIGTVESRYDQLNQIIKWSLALDFAKKQHGNLSFLEKYSVRRDLWFPDWVSKNQGKRNAPPWIDCFHQRGKYLDDVETMPVLHVGWPNAPDTWCEGTPDKDSLEYMGLVWFINGGVSLPRVSSFKHQYNPKFLASSPHIKRTNLVNDGLLVSDAKTTLKLYPEYNSRPTFRIETEPTGGAKLTRTAERVKQERDGTWVNENASVYHRGNSAEMHDMPFVEQVSKNAHHTNVKTSIGEHELASTTFTVNDNVVRIHQESRVIDIGNSLALKLNRLPEESWLDSLIKDPRVAVVTKFDEKSPFLIKIQETNKWLEFVVEEKIGVDIPKGYISRVSSQQTIADTFFDITPKSVAVRVIPEIEVTTRAKQFELLTVTQRLTDKGALTLDIRGPPSTPPPPKGPTFTIGASNSSGGGYRGIIGKDKNDGSLVLYVEKGKTNQDINTLIAVADDTNLSKKLQSKTDAPIELPIPNSQIPIEMAAANKLAAAHENALSMGFIKNPQKTVDAIQKSRAGYIDTLKEAAKNSSQEVYKRLQLDIGKSFSFQGKERLELTLVSLGKHLSPNERRELKAISERVSKDMDMTEELSSWISTKLVAQDSHVLKILLNNTAQKGRDKPHDFNIKWVDGEPQLQVTLYHPVEGRPLRQNELKDIGELYIDPRISPEKLPTIETISNIVNDGIVLEIRNPEQFVNKSIAKMDLDTITLAGIGDFKRITKTTPKSAILPTDTKLTPNSFAIPDKTKELALLLAILLLSEEPADNDDHEKPMDNDDREEPTNLLLITDRKQLSNNCRGKTILARVK